MKHSIRSAVKRRFPSLVWRLRDLRRYGRSSLALYQQCRDVHFVPIVGMHRSGTSCVTRILADNGLHLGSNLVRARAANPEGFWEARAAVAVNRELLRRFDADYLDPPPFLPRFPGGLYRRARRFLLNLGQRDVVGWKDPRTTVTWEAWHELLYKNHHTLVACFRHPRKVAGSLRAIYQDMDEEAALRSWLKYNRRLLALADDVVWINFDAPLGDQIPVICQSLGLDFNPDSLSSYKPSLIHHRAGQDEPAGIPEVDRAYAWLMECWSAQHARRGSPAEKTLV